MQITDIKKKNILRQKLHIMEQEIQNLCQKMREKKKTFSLQHLNIKQQERQKGRKNYSWLKINFCISFMWKFELLSCFFGFSTIQFSSDTMRDVDGVKEGWGNIWVELTQISVIFGRVRVFLQSKLITSKIPPIVTGWVSRVYPANEYFEVYPQDIP